MNHLNNLGRHRSTFPKEVPFLNLFREEIFLILVGSLLELHYMGSSCILLFNDLRGDVRVVYCGYHLKQRSISV